MPTLTSRERILQDMQEKAELREREYEEHFGAALSREQYIPAFPEAAPLPKGIPGEVLAPAYATTLRELQASITKQHSGRQESRQAIGKTIPAPAPNSKIAERERAGKVYRELHEANRVEALVCLDKKLNAGASDTHLVDTLLRREREYAPAQEYIREAICRIVGNAVHKPLPNSRYAEAYERTRLHGDVTRLQEDTEGEVLLRLLELRPEDAGTWRRSYYKLNGVTASELSLNAKRLPLPIQSCINGSLRKRLKRIRSLVERFGAERVDSRIAPLPEPRFGKATFYGKLPLELPKPGSEEELSFREKHEESLCAAQEAGVITFVSTERETTGYFGVLGYAKAIARQIALRLAPKYIMGRVEEAYSVASDGTEPERIAELRIAEWKLRLGVEQWQAERKIRSGSMTVEVLLLSLEAPGASAKEIAALSGASEASVYTIRSRYLQDCAESILKHLAA